MAAIGDKRKRFLGAGNDAMEVTSLVRSRVALPTTRSDCGPDGDVKYPHHPSPGTIWTSSRLALQNDATASRCVAFVASAGEVFRHAVPFAGAGERVEEGKGSLLKSTTVDDGVTRVVRCVKHASEIQSLALYDPPDGGDVVLASVDAYGGGFVTTLRRGGGDDDGEWSGDAPVRQYALAPHEPAGPGTSVPGWAGAAFDRDGDGGVLAVARHFDKAVDVYENGKRARTLRTTLCPHAVSFARDPNRRGGIRTGSSADGPPLLAVAEGNHVSLWDVRAREKGGLVKRTSISNRGDDATFVLDCGLAGGDDGGGGVSLPNARAGEPMILCAGADRGVTVVNETRMRAVARWTNAMKFEITGAKFSAASPDHVYVASGLDYELVCGCWTRQAIAGGFSFRGDSRLLGMATSEAGAGKDIVAAWCESGNLIAARVERVGGTATATATGGGGGGDGGDGETTTTARDESRWNRVNKKKQRREWREQRAREILEEEEMQKRLDEAEPVD